ncbi:MAG: hypothetical protein WC376_00015 [Candidatus Nanoarchaeia archaeon]|jgi:uncharacterized membrane protein YhfC
MKKALLLAILLILPIGFSCYNNSITINSVNSLENTYAMLLLEQRFNSFSNNSFLYNSLNDSGVKLKVSNDSIIVQSLNDSADWKNILTDELYFLWNYNATLLSEEDIVFISNLECCGVYDNGQFIKTNETCSEEINIPKKDDSAILAILVAIIPFLIMLFYFSRLDYKKYLVFIFGIIGWLAAFVLRIPLLNQVSLTANFWVIMLLPSLLSGLFEEGVRYLSLRFAPHAKRNFFLFAIGWSFAEILIIYCFNIVYFLSFNQQVSFVDALPGLIERFSATILHLAFTIIVLKSLKNKKLLGLAMGLHIAVNLFGILLLTFNLNVWIIELILILLAFLVYNISNKLKEGTDDGKRRDFKKIKRKK